MRRKNDVKVSVDGPQTGLVTRFPTDLTAKGAQSALSQASNVRAQDGALENAPGYERVVTDGEDLDSAPISFFQANILNTSRDIRRSVLIGTAGKVFEMKRRSVDIQCAADQTCALRVAFTADSGYIGDPIADVTAMIRQWGPDLVLHAGDLVYAGGYGAVGGATSSSQPYEDLVAQYYWPWIGNYSGGYGTGPDTNRFFTTCGNHDFTDWPFDKYRSFFQLPGNETYYSIKKGPVHFIFLNAVPPTWSGYDGWLDCSVGSPQHAWAVNEIQTSTSPWVVVIGHAPPYTSDANHTPGFADVRWLDSVGGVSLTLWGHAHNYERLVSNGLTHIVAGNGGAPLRSFATPVPESVFGDDSEFGAVLIDATAEKLAVKYYRRDGTLMDTYENLTPLRALDSCVTGLAAESLEIVPASMGVEAGQSFQYTALLTQTDGNIVDVTGGTTVWDVSDGTIANITAGRATGLSVGGTQISATYAGLQAYADLQVTLPCVDISRDWLFCVERTTSMAAVQESKTVLEHIADAAAGCLSNMTAGADKSGLTSFSGTYATQTHDAYIDSELSVDHTQTLADFRSLRGYGDSDISAGLDLCFEQLLDAEIHDPEHRGLVVLIVDGPARVTDPGGDGTEATAMAAAAVSADRIKTLPNALVIVLGYQVDPAYEADVKALASPGWYFGISNIQQLKNTIQLLPSTVCFVGGEPYDPGYSCVSPQLDYFGFINWDVTNGVVDLCGEGTNGIQLYDQFPGNGLYVDMVGTDPKNAVGEKRFEGELTSKVAYNFEAGKTYKISVDVSGTGRAPNKSPITVRTTIGGLTTMDAVKPAGSQSDPFRTFSREFVASATTSEHVVISIIRSENDPVSVVGVFIKDVRLENLTDTTVMLLDSFDGENACPP